MGMQHPLLRAILVVAFGIAWRTLGYACQERCGHQRKHDYEGSHGITPSSLGLRRGAAASAGLPQHWGAGRTHDPRYPPVTGHNEARSRRCGRTVRLITKHSAVSRARRTASTQLAALSRHDKVIVEAPMRKAPGKQPGDFDEALLVLRPLPY